MDEHVETMTVTDIGDEHIELRAGSSGCAPRIPAGHGLTVGDQVAVTFTSFMGEIAAVDHDGRRILERDATTRAAEHARNVASTELKRIDEFIDGRRAKLDAAYAGLPALFRRRIDKFRDTKGPSWRWEFEPYESMVCVDAVKIAETCAAALQLEPGLGIDADDLQKQVGGWLDVHANQVDGIDGGHSGNSFGMAKRLAYWWLTAPDMVVADHGALTPLVGCEKYGCPHPAGEGSTGG